MRVSVVIPVFNGCETIETCLRKLVDSRYSPAEIIVVDDGSTDDSAAIADRYGVTVLSTGGRRGPARARNIGARYATGDLLVFLDADVAVHPDTLERIAASVEADPTIDAVIGAYDDNPADAGFVSQFKNLMHAYVHRQGNREAWTFWCGCGAVKRSVYLEHGGLDETYVTPSIEDIELGYRMRAAGRRIVLDPLVRGTHLKRWTLANMIRTDVLQRGIPWTELILRTGVLPADLNLKMSQRISVALTFSFAALAVYGTWQALSAAVACLLTICILNRDFYAFLAARKGWLFAISSIPFHILYFFYSGVSSVLGVCSHLIRQVRRTTPPTASEIGNNPEW